MRPPTLADLAGPETEGRPYHHVGGIEPPPWRTDRWLVWRNRFATVDMVLHQWGGHWFHTGPGYHVAGWVYPCVANNPACLLIRCWHDFWDLHAEIKGWKT